MSEYAQWSTCRRKIRQGEALTKAWTLLRREWPPRGVSDIFSNMDSASGPPRDGGAGGDKRWRRTLREQMRHPYITEQGLKPSVGGEAAPGDETSPAAPTTTRGGANGDEFDPRSGSDESTDIEAGRSGGEGK